MILLITLNQSLNTGEFLKIFKCLKCSNCCLFKSDDETPLVFPWEVSRIQSFSSNQLFKPYLAYRSSELYIVVLYKWIINGKCIFLTKNNDCRIHFEKPLSCRIYPLLVNLSDNTLRLSLSCRFVKESLNNTESIDPARVFRNEYYNALLVYILLKIIDDHALTSNWVREIVYNKIDTTRDKYINVDEVIDIDKLVNDIKSSLAKYSDKPT